MVATHNHIQLFRGVLQSSDGVISKVFHSTEQTISFEAAFTLSEELKERITESERSIDRLTHQDDPFIFSERSRIARLGIQINGESPYLGKLDGNILSLSMVASHVIPGYPTVDILQDFFAPGFQIGRLIYCDPQALLNSDEVLAALESGSLKLPDSTTISSDGTVLIKPHSAVCRLREPLSKDILSRILLRDEGRELLNQYQRREDVPTVIIPPNEGIVTTCSMYLNEHYVVLQSGFQFGKQLQATVLDPIKTRGVNIYLEIVNNSRNTIVNPVILAKIYRSHKFKEKKRKKTRGLKNKAFTYNALKGFEKRFQAANNSTCHFVDRPLAVIEKKSVDLNTVPVLLNGPDALCTVSKINCSMVRRYASPHSVCPHIFATARIKQLRRPATLILKYFPNIVEHRDIINWACKGKINAIYFFEPSSKFGAFLSDRDHNQLEEYYELGIDVYWISELTGSLMVSTMRDGKGYFVIPERLAEFHKSMLFAFYGSNKGLSKTAVKRLGELVQALIDFWGHTIGIITGGGSGVMEEANNIARRQGILSGANFLEITDQKMTTDVDFCQVFQAKCRHSRQKWFEVAAFPIFNVGGLGSMEELGITLCNFKLSIAETVPIILFGTEGDETFWNGAREQILEMVAHDRAPGWIKKYLIMTSDPRAVVKAYKDILQLF
jgi:predicted Rossmann-fold nucleotide-binding protein